ncbi:hypothetical protein jhhlp_003585 [Lomentospora prolificans]|uniref:N-acetyltransferase domain-containing protein n=1 Tax=Lomentospora prolificans TaxID=41688 RepID=A0A2N3N9C2_9PEZI|nr:hypothetical protein jhhlp_003585 [Lomentospora prolificans]
MKELQSDKLRFVPFDGKSEDHAKVLYLQRVACGWNEDLIEEWTEAHEAGSKGIYWLNPWPVVMDESWCSAKILRDDFPNREKLVQDHFVKFPEEKRPLKDTSAFVLGSKRLPTNEEFVAIGHIAVERQPRKDQMLNLVTEEVAWITCLYISFAMHDHGLGRDAMKWAEKMVAREPFNAKMAYLDTTDGEFQLLPHVLKSNEDWYIRQGYQVVHRKAEGYPWITPDGNAVWIPQVFLKKDLTS